MSVTNREIIDLTVDDETVDLTLDDDNDDCIVAAGWHPRSEYLRQFLPDDYFIVCASSAVTVDGSSIGNGCFVTRNIPARTKLRPFHHGGEWIGVDERDRRIAAGSGCYILHANSSLSYDLFRVRDQCSMSMINCSRGLVYQSGRFAAGTAVVDNCRMTYASRMDLRTFFVVSLVDLRAGDELFIDYGGEYHLVPPDDVLPPSTAADLQSAWEESQHDRDLEEESGFFRGVWDPHDPRSDRPPEFHGEDWHGYSYWQVYGTGEAFEEASEDC